jgi:hypothetical protein
MFLFRSRVIGWSESFRHSPIDSSRNSCYTGSGLSADRHHLHVRRWPSMPSKSPTPMCCTYLTRSLSRLSLRRPHPAEHWPDCRRHLRSDHRHPGTNALAVGATRCRYDPGDAVHQECRRRSARCHGSERSLASEAQTGRRSPIGGRGLRAAPRAFQPVKSREEVQTS